MSRRALGPASLEVALAVREVLDGVDEATVGCSGGPDSLALAMGALWASNRTGTRVRAVVVDHQLQAGSDAVAARTAAVLAGHGMESLVVPVDVDPGHPDGPEAAARLVRRRALLDHAGAGPVLLGHTLDDQAETVLLGLARGSGARSASGMRMRAGRFWHPLLGVRRATTEAACRQWDLRPWLDPQNEDANFLRSRVRMEVMPVLRRVLGEAVVTNLARSADLLAADDEALDRVVDGWLASRSRRSGEGDELEALDVDALAELPGGLVGRVVKRWLEGRGVRAGAVHVDAVRGLLVGRGGAGVDLPGGRAVRVGRRVVWNAGPE